ncbi:unnamed protein product, partial [Didymodactylos carnosus]
MTITQSWNQLANGKPARPGLSESVTGPVQP